MLDIFASALINGDTSGLDDDDIKLYALVTAYLDGCDVTGIRDGDPFFATCEATGVRGSCVTYELRIPDRVPPEVFRDSESDHLANWAHERDA